MNDVMAEWSDFYTLIGATAGTLIGLIFVVVNLGADNAKAGDEHRVHIGVTPTLVHFATLLVGALAMLAPLSNIARAVALGVIGCAGLAYLVNLALLASKRIKDEERDTLWFGILPMAAYAGFVVTRSRGRSRRNTRLRLAASPASFCLSRRCTTAGR